MIDEKRQPPTGVLSGRRAPRKATLLRAHSHPTRTPSRHPPPLGMSCDGRGAKAYVSAYRRAARGGVGPVPSRLEVRTSDKLCSCRRRQAARAAVQVRTVRGLFVPTQDRPLTAAVNRSTSNHSNFLGVRQSAPSQSAWADCATCCVHACTCAYKSLCVGTYTYLH